MKALKVLPVLLILFSCAKEAHNRGMLQTAVSIIASGDITLTYKHYHVLDGAYNPNFSFTNYNPNDIDLKEGVHEGVDSLDYRFTYPIGDKVEFVVSGQHATVILYINGHQYGDQLDFCGTQKFNLLIE